MGHLVGECLFIQSILILWFTIWFIKYVFLYLLCSLVCIAFCAVDVIVTLECIQLYILCIVPRCLFQEVSVMYLSMSCPDVPIGRFNNVNKSCQVIMDNPPIVQGLKSPQLWGPRVIRLS